MENGKNKTKRVGLDSDPDSDGLDSDSDSDSDSDWVDSDVTLIWTHHFIDITMKSKYIIVLR